MFKQNLVEERLLSGAKEQEEALERRRPREAASAAERALEPDASLHSADASPLLQQRLLRAQRTVGNRAVQRAIQKDSAKAAASSSKKSIQRRGRTLPGGTYILGVSADRALIIDAAYRAAYKSVGGHANRVRWETHLGPLIDAALDSKLSSRTVPIHINETSGVNMNYRGHITFQMGDPQPVEQGTTATTMTTGGQTATGIETSEATTDSASISGKGTLSPGEGGGYGGEAGGTASTSTTTSDKRTRTVTSGQTGSAQANLTQTHYRAPLQVRAVVTGEAAFSGSDYINPFKWGYAAADAALSNGEQSHERTVGTIRYFEPQGFAPTQRRGWLEQATGAEGFASDHARVQSLVGLASEPLKTTGAKPLPPMAAQLAEGYHNTNLSDVRVVQGAQSDSYCNAMDAAAFCTPGAGGGSEIFLHSQVALDTPQGQHTLQHEIAHAAQQKRGQADSLIGLGGDEGVRKSLEDRADRDANAILSFSGGERAKESD